MQFEALLSFATFEQLNDSFSFTSPNGWGNINMRNYLLLHKDVNVEEFEAKASELYRENFGEFLKEMGVDLSVGIIPLTNVYLLPDSSNGFGPKGSMNQVYLVSGIAIFVLLLACINYINLSTARAVYRAREVGMRKIVGSSRSAIFWQFQIEVFMLTLVSFMLVTLFLDMILPLFNDLMGKQYEFSTLTSVEMVIAIIVLIVTISFLAGYYPSRVLSGYAPAEVLKARMGSGRKGVNLRRGLVIFQFAISCMLVMATFIVIGQLRYMQEQDLGFDKEQVLVFDVTRVPAQYYSAFAEGLRDQSGITAVSLTNALPGRPGWQGQWAYPDDNPQSDYVDTEYMAVDEHYLDMLNLTLLAGRNFDPARPADRTDGLIINETTVREMGWETPENAIGKRIVSPSNTPAGEVIGVVQDYHGEGLQREIWPMAMAWSSNDYGHYFAVRFTTGNTSELLSSVESLWKSTLGDYTFDYFFLNQEFEKQYRSEQQLMQVFILFAILTVIIAAIGLLGLVSFMVVSRTREIGIRKVMGATSSLIVRLLSKEFLILVVLANLVVIPLVWITGSSWLDNFAYHMPVNPMIFILTLAITIILAALVVGAQTLLAARQNPAEILRRGE
jgi:putative ABC transport system permease protein